MFGFNRFAFALSGLILTAVALCAENFDYRTLGDGDWIECEQSRVGTSGQKHTYTLTREIKYEDDRNDNSITALTSDGKPLSGCLIYVCDEDGSSLPYVNTYVSDIDGKVYNLPFFDGMTYKLSFYGWYKDAFLKANPQAVVIMK